MTSRSKDDRVDEDSGHGRLRSAEDSRRHVRCAEAVWLPREQRASVCRDGRGQFTVRDGSGSQAMTTAATAHGRGGRHARCCARKPKAKRTHRAPATHTSNASNTQHHLTQQQATLHSKWHEPAREDHSSGVSRDAGITPNKERDQGPFTLTVRRRRQRLCEGRTGRAIIVMTIASRWREALTEKVQGTDGSSETSENPQCDPTGSSALKEK